MVKELLRSMQTAESATPEAASAEPPAATKMGSEALAVAAATLVLATYIVRFNCDPRLAQAGGWLPLRLNGHRSRARVVCS